MNGEAEFRGMMHARYGGNPVTLEIIRHVGERLQRYVIMRNEGAMS